jgi:Methyltransferase domain
MVSFKNLLDLVTPITTMNMDIRHIKLLHRVLKIGRFNHTLEIGSFDGASATAFVSALDKGVVNRIDFCDPSFQPRFYKIISMSTKPEFITMHRRFSFDVISDKYDCVFVDGDHSPRTVGIETELILKNGIQNIFAHDTSLKVNGCEGPAIMMNRLKKEGFYVVEDNKRRPNEITERGFMFATKNTDLFEKAEKLFLSC